MGGRGGTGKAEDSQGVTGGGSDTICTAIAIYSYCH